MDGQKVEGIGLCELLLDDLDNLDMKPHSVYACMGKVRLASSPSTPSSN